MFFRREPISRRAMVLPIVIIVSLFSRVWAAIPSFAETATPTSTLSATSTVTLTPTPSYTLTPVPTNTPSYQFWRDDFDTGPPGAQPAGWLDETNNVMYNAQIVYTAQFSIARVARTPEDIWGKVLSPPLNCNTSIYSHVEVRVTSLSPALTWKIGIQEIGGAWQYQDLCLSQNEAVTRVYNYAAVMGWTGSHNFYIQLTAEGMNGTYFEVDYVSVREPPPTPTPTATMTYTYTSTPTLTVTPTWTHTPTVTPSSTVTPTLTYTLTSTHTSTLTHTPYYSPTSTGTHTRTKTPSGTTTASPTVTPTPSRTQTPPGTYTSTPSPTITLEPTHTAPPFLLENEIILYPNPARDRVLISCWSAGETVLTMDIFNVSGERVARVVRQQDGGIGQPLTTAWDSRSLAPGIYFARIVIQDMRGRVVLNQVKKIALIK